MTQPYPKAWYFVFPVANLASFRAWYATKGVRIRHEIENEKVVPLLNEGGTHYIVSSRRFQEPHSSNAKVGRPWLEIYTEVPTTEQFDWPQDPHDKGLPS